jgi:hypothetical protein
MGLRVPASRTSRVYVNRLTASETLSRQAAVLPSARCQRRVAGRRVRLRRTGGTRSPPKPKASPPCPQLPSSVVMVFNYHDAWKNDPDRLRFGSLGEHVFVVSPPPPTRK